MAFGNKTILVLAGPNTTNILDEPMGLAGMTILRNPTRLRSQPPEFWLLEEHYDAAILHCDSAVRRSNQGKTHQQIAIAVARACKRPLAIITNIHLENLGNDNVQIFDPREMYTAVAWLATQVN